MPTLDLLHVAALIDVIRGLVMTLFVISAMLVMLVVLAQEGKGGGLSGAFGGAGAETFGVKAGTVNAFTSWLAAGFLGLALLYAGLRAASKTDVERDTRANTEEFTSGAAGDTAGGVTLTQDGTGEGAGDAATGDAADGDAAEGDATDGGADGAGDAGDEDTPPADGP